jgi:hypothetical protein
MGEADVRVENPHQPVGETVSLTFPAHEAASRRERGGLK